MTKVFCIIKSIVDEPTRKLLSFIAIKSVIFIVGTSIATVTRNSSIM